MDSVKILCLLMMMIGYVSSDIAQDRKQCQDQLIGLSSCLVYVSGESRLPTPACCAELRNDLKKTKLCLCLLVKDRNEPGLGLKINGTLALSLPYICHAPTNASECLALLHLAPNSPDAKIFEDFSNNSVNINNTTVGEINYSNSSKELMIKRWIDMLLLHGGIPLWLLIMALINFF